MGNVGRFSSVPSMNIMDERRETSDRVSPIAVTHQDKTNIISHLSLPSIARAKLLTIDRVLSYAMNSRSFACDDEERTNRISICSDENGSTRLTEHFCRQAFFRTRRDTPKCYSGHRKSNDQEYYSRPRSNASSDRR